MKIKLNKNKWEIIGKKAGWIKITNTEFKEYKFHSIGDLHRNVLLNTLEQKYGLTFRDYDLSTIGIKANNQKTEQILNQLFNKI